MSSENFLVRRDIAQTLRLEELVREKDGLIINLHVAETEIGRLKVVIERLEDGRQVLSVKLEDANNEIGRLGMVLKHQPSNLESAPQHGKKI